MRIGLDYRPVTAAPYSGIARQVLALEHALQMRPGVEVIRYTAAPLDHPHRLTACCPEWPSPIHGLHRPQERLKFECLFLPSALRRAPLLDVYIATANSGLPILRVPARTKRIQLLHDVFQLTLENHHANRLKALAYRWIDRIAIRSSLAVADAIWCPSNHTLHETAQLFPSFSNRMAHLPNAVPAVGEPHAEPVEGIPEHGYWLLVGTREPRKNIAWFLQQWLQARCRVPGGLPELVLVGSAGDVPAYVREVEGVHFVEGLTEAQMQYLYANADRLWQPSFAEGFGLPVVEAMTHGTPVAVARGSALDEVAPPEAPRFDPSDGEGLQALMCDLRPPCRASSEQADALRQWASRYDLPQYAERVWQLLDPWKAGGPA